MRWLAGGVALLVLVVAGVVFAPQSSHVVQSLWFSDAAKSSPGAANADIPVTHKQIDSHLYALSVATIKIPGPVERGALALLDDDVLVADRAGALFQINPRKGKLARLSFSVPVAEPHPSLRGFERKTFSVLDIEVIGGKRLYASYLVHDAERACILIALAAIEIAKDATGAIAGTGDWRPIYKTNPCIPVKVLQSGGLYGSGGRIEGLGRKILLTVGSMAMDGLDRDPSVSQDRNGDYGKILLIDPETGGAEIFTTGHRNPQGLAVLSDGRIVSAEHGPRGGDEINMIVQGGDYGWPQVTYGTRVYYRDWPPSKATLGRHEGFRKPLFAFVPSLGVSELIEIKDNRQFPLWNGNLVLASLLARTLVRLQVEDDRVIYTERIELGHRLRDIAALSDGAIVALTDDDRLLVVTDNTAVTKGKIGAPTQ